MAALRADGLAATRLGKAGTCMAAFGRIACASKASAPSARATRGLPSASVSERPFRVSGANAAFRLAKPGGIMVAVGGPMRISLLIAIAGAMLVVTTPYAQVPGDRPAGNPRGTRSVAVARNGMIATSQALASAAGLKVLQDGGNAIDAAITAAGVLAVVEPTMNGIGGDLFAIVCDAKTKKLHALDASGRSAHTATPEEFAKRGLKQMPGGGVLVRRRARRRRRLEPAAAALRHDPDGQGAAARDSLRARRIPGSGDPRRRLERLGEEAVSRIRRRPQRSCPTAARRGWARSSRTRDSPRRLELIAQGGRDAFYKGPIARAIVADMRARNGLLDERDFTTHTADWVETISTNYRGYDVHEMPPSTQGFVALEMLNILEGFDIKAMGHNTRRLPAPRHRSQEDRVRRSRRVSGRSRARCRRTR